MSESNYDSPNDLMNATEPENDLFTDIPFVPEETKADTDNCFVTPVVSEYQLAQVCLAFYITVCVRLNIKAINMQPLRNGCILLCCLKIYPNYSIHLANLLPTKSFHLLSLLNFHLQIILLR